MRILILLPNQPFPPTTGQTHRYAHLARYLACHDEVSVLCFSDAAGRARLDPTLTDRFSDIQLIDIESIAPKGSLRDRLRLAPSEVGYYESEEMRARLQQMIDRHQPELILVGDPVLTPYIAALRGPRKVLDYVCETLLQLERMRALAPLSGKPAWTLRRWKFARFLRQIADVYDLCILNSDEDYESLVRVWPSERIRVITNGLDPTDYPLGLAEPVAGRMVYPGSVEYPPNRDAVAWFIESCLPAIRREVPEAHLIVTGPVPEDGSEPRGEGVSYSGYLDDVKPMIASAWLNVIPLRLGAGGARFKVLESLALGTPMVSTAIGFEGLAVSDGENILQAEDAPTITRRCIEVLQSPELRQRIASGGRSLFERRYTWDILGGEIRAEFAAL